MPHTYENCIVVPQSSTFELQDKVYVYKVVNGVATSTMINVVNISNGREYIVNSGLTPGDVIVNEGVGLMREGTPIKAKNQQATATATPAAESAAAAEPATEKEE